MTNWDDEIDDVARAMTDAEPEPAFNARVIAQLDRRRTPWWVTAILTPIAVAVVVAIGVVLARRLPDTHETARPPVRTVAQAAQDASIQPGTVNTPQSIAPRVSIERAREGERTAVVRLPAELVAFARSDDAASLEPAPIEVEPLGVEAMDAMESIQITRLEVAPLEVPAMSAE